MNTIAGSRWQEWIALTLVLQLSIGWAASPAIGVVVAKGSVAVDTSRVAGSGTLFEGSVVETTKATSELRMAGGARMLLDSGSRGKVYRDYVVLEKGAGQLEQAAGFGIHAGSFRIDAASPAKAKVEWNGAKQVKVTAFGGPVQVRNEAGLLLAKLMPGRAVALQAAAAGAGSNAVRGCLRKADGHYLLTDQVSGVTFELQGRGLEREVGRIVEVSGSLEASSQPVAPAAQVLRVSQVKSNGEKKAEGCDAGAAGAAGAGAGAGAAGAATAAGTAGASGISASTAVIAGVVVAGAAAGLGIGLTREESESISQ